MTHQPGGRKEPGSLDFSTFLSLAPDSQVGAPCLTFLVYTIMSPSLNYCENQINLKCYLGCTCNDYGYELAVIVTRVN